MTGGGGERGRGSCAFGEFGDGDSEMDRIPLGFGGVL